MKMSEVSWVLASQSPRRREIFIDLNLVHEAISPNILEKRKPNESIRNYITRNVEEKLNSVQSLVNLNSKNSSKAILSADTVVVLNEQLLEKPRDKAEAVSMLTQLSGSWHSVLSSFGFWYKGQIFTKTLETKVLFCELSQEDILRYVDTGEPMDKAGSYGAQGMGRYFVKEISGSYLNVIGLPIPHVKEAWEIFTR